MKFKKWLAFASRILTMLVLGSGTCMAATGWVRASPSHMVIEQGQLGTTVVSWQVSGASTGQVYVSTPGGAETLMAEGASGSASAAWIQPGRPYVFRLYEGTAHTTLLSWTSVTTQNPPDHTFGFNYWPAGHSDDTLYNANWSKISPQVQADLDHIASMGGGVIRIFFWPQVSGFGIAAGAGGSFNSQLTEIAENLPAFLKLCADRKISVIITFGNNFYDANDPSTGKAWWTDAYGDTSQGFARFLNDTAHWANTIIDAVENSAYANTVIYYDMENEFNRSTEYADWYISFFYDWTHVPDGKRGVSVLDPKDAPELISALASSAGPKQGLRRLDYVDFHTYITSSTYPNYDRGTPESIATYLRGEFPGTTILMGEFGYQTNDSSPNGSADTLNQQRAELMAISDANNAGVSYYLNWLLWDAIGSDSMTPSFGRLPDTPRDVLGGVSAQLNLAYNPDMEIVSNGAPAGWGASGTVPITLTSQNGYGYGNAQTNFRYARVSTSSTSGAVWLASSMMPVKGGHQLFANAYIRASMTNVHLAVVEYDQNKNWIQSDDGPSFTPSGWQYVSYLHKIAAGCSGSLVNMDGCSWHVALQPGTAYVILTVGGNPVATSPSYLDVDTVSVWQRP